MKKNRKHLAIIIVAILIVFPACRKEQSVPPGATRGAADTETVGIKDANRTVVPVNQVVTPAGIQVSLPGLRPQALALSPDGKLLAVSGKTHELVILDPAAGKVRQRVTLPAETRGTSSPEAPSDQILQPDEKGQLSYTGLIFSRDGARIYLSNVNGSIKVFEVGADGTVVPSRTIPLPPAGAPRRDEEIPAGLALTEDGRRLFVCGNLSNRLLEIDTETGAVLRTTDVGVAPFDVVLAGGKAYVSNWGGRRPEPGDITGPAGRGTLVRVDPVRFIASEGSVSVIDLESGEVRSEIMVGLHSSALALAPDGRHLVCANAASDNISVIDTATDAVVETIWAKQSPADLFGASPNALAFSADGKTLYAANGTQNAVAVIEFAPAGAQVATHRASSRSAGSREPSLSMPAGKRSASPTSKATPSNQLTYGATGAQGFNSHQYHRLGFARPPAR